MILTTVVFCLRHEHALLDFHAVYFVGEDAGTDRDETPSGTVALRMDRARIRDRQVVSLVAMSSVSSSLASSSRRPTALGRAVSNP